MQTFMTDGYINKTEKGYHYFEAKDNKKAMACYSISTRRPYAKKDESGYYPYDLIPARSYGQTAEFINKYPKHRDNMIYKGYFVMDPAVEKADGTSYPAHLVFIVEAVEFATGNTNNNDTASNNSSTVTSAAPRQQQNRNAFAPF